MVLSQVYSHNKLLGASVTDLLLAARVMFFSAKEPLLITGNKKHYLSKIFETKGVMVCEEEESGHVYNFYVLQFNQQELKNCLGTINQIPVPEKKPPEDVKIPF